MLLKILQWNVFYKEDPNKIAALIKRINPDVVCAQELMQHSKSVPLIDTAKQIAEQLNYYYIYQQTDSWDNRPEKETQGNAIFSKQPFVRTDHIYIQPPKHNPLDAEHVGRVYLEVQIEFGGKQITFGTTHLSYTPHFMISEKRQEETDNLVEILETKHRNFIFTADMNATPDSYPVKQIKQMTVLKHAGPDFEHKTWTTKPFNKGGFEADTLDWRIDYIFTTPDMKVVDSEVVQTNVSDHLPILVSIDV